MTGPVGAPRPPAYATLIPGRRVEFKRHNTLGQAKTAVASFPFFARDTGRPRVGPLWGVYTTEPDGVFQVDMIVYRLDECQLEYVPWIEIKGGSRRSQYPDLMPLTEAKG